MFRLAQEVVYTHLDGDTGEETTISISQLTAMLKLIVDTPGMPGIMFAVIPLEKDMVEHIEKYSGIEPYRIKRIKKDDIPRYPVYIIKLENDTHTVCDGNHRIVKAWRLGFREIRAIIILPELWRQCVLPMPPVPGDTFEEKTTNLHRTTGVIGPL